MNYSTQATFGLKKPAIQQGQKNFSVLNSFNTYGGFTPLISQISMQSFVVLRCLATEKCCLELLKIQQRGDPRVIRRSVQNLNFFLNHLILLQISCSFHIWKPLMLQRTVLSQWFRLFNTGHFWAKGTCLAAEKCGLKQEVNSAKSLIQQWFDQNKSCSRGS